MAIVRFIASGVPKGHLHLLIDLFAMLTEVARYQVT